MKRIVLALALAGFAAATTASPAVACEGGKCKMEHRADGIKAKKGKKEAAKTESCPMNAASAETAKPSCCMMKDAATSNAAASKAKK